MDNSLGTGCMAVFAVSGSVVFLAVQVHKRLLSNFMEKMEFEIKNSKGFSFLFLFFFPSFIFVTNLHDILCREGERRAKKEGKILRRRGGGEVGGKEIHGGDADQI